MAETSTQAIKRLREQNDELLDAGKEMADCLEVTVKWLEKQRDIFSPLSERTYKRALAAWRRVA